MKNKNTKAVAAGVGLLALCQGGYIYNQSGDIDKITEQMEVASAERGKILSDLEVNKAQSDSLIGQNSELTRAILEDEKKISILNNELRAAKLKFEKLQKSYNMLKAKSEAMASNLNNSSNAIKNENNLAIAKEKARQKEVLRIAKDSMERERLVALAAKKAEADKARLQVLAAKNQADERAKLEALASKKSEAEKLRLAKELAEKARLEALASKKSEAERLTAEKQAAEKARLEALASKKSETGRLAAEKQAAEKARLDAVAASKIEAQQQQAAEKARLDAVAASKIEAQKQAAEKARLDAVAASKIEAQKQATEKAKVELIAAKKNNEEESKLLAVNLQKNEVEKAAARELQEKNRIQTLIEKKKSEIAKARQAIADRNKADEDAINNNKILPTTTTSTKEVEYLKPTASKNTPKSITNQNTQLAEKLSKIKVTNVNASSYRYINEETKEEEETDDSSEVGFFKVNFTIPQSFVVRASERNYFIQVLDENGNFVGDVVSEIIDGEKVTYCQRSNVKYKNRALKVTEYIFMKGLKEGIYTINLLDKNELVSKSTIVLN